MEDFKEKEHIHLLFNLQGGRVHRGIAIIRIVFRNIFCTTPPLQNRNRELYHQGHSLCACAVANFIKLILSWPLSLRMLKVTNIRFPHTDRICKNCIISFHFYFFIHGGTSDYKICFTYRPC